jgi:hypothetical protein
VTVLIVLSCVNAVFAFISCWSASRASTHREMARVSAHTSAQHALISQTSADILAKHSRACGQHPEASGR